MIKSCWNAPGPASFTLDGTTHIWLISLEPDNPDELNRYLSATELGRANRFAFDKHRRHFIAAHAQLRIILGNYLDARADSLSFEQNSYGKPFIKNFPLYFNISHSNLLGLIAVNGKHDVGVDIEWNRPNFNELRIADRFFSATETKQLYALPAELQKKAFFNCWSRKEAYIKARGKGLAIPLDQFQVSLRPDEPAEIISTEHDPIAAKEWKLAQIVPDEQYSGAVVVNQKDLILEFWDGKLLTSI